MKVNTMLAAIIFATSKSAYLAAAPGIQDLFIKHMLQMRELHFINPVGYSEYYYRLLGEEGTTQAPVLDENGIMVTDEKDDVIFYDRYEIPTYNNMPKTVKELIDLSNFEFISHDSNIDRSNAFERPLTLEVFGELVEASDTYNKMKPFGSAIFLVAKTIQEAVYAYKALVSRIVESENVIIDCEQIVITENFAIHARSFNIPEISAMFLRELFCDYLITKQK